MMALTTRISATVAPSTVSRMLVPRLAGEMVSASASAMATPTRMNGAQLGGCGHTPISCRNAVPKIPVAEEVTTP
jgi:hypothetical protein